MRPAPSELTLPPPGVLWLLPVMQLWPRWAARLLRPHPAAARARALGHSRSDCLAREMTPDCFSTISARAVSPPPSPIPSDGVFLTRRSDTERQFKDAKRLKFASRLPSPQAEGEMRGRGFRSGPPPRVGVGVDALRRRCGAPGQRAVAHASDAAVTAMGSRPRPSPPCCRPGCCGDRLRSSS